MFAYLKALASRMLRDGWRLPPPPVDPDVSVREPRRRGPGGNRSAAAVLEPREPSVVAADGAAARRAGARGTANP
jgi:hypothetical protein